MNFKVGVRVRPLSTREKNIQPRICIDMPDTKTVRLRDFQQPQSVREFQFDYCFWSADGFVATEHNPFEPDCEKYASEDVVFQTIGIQILDAAAKGKNSCLYCYGEAGAGKTHNMYGRTKSEGIVYKTCREIFKRIQANKNATKYYALALEMYMIRSEEIYDLLIESKMRGERLRIRQIPIKGVFIEGLSSKQIHSFQNFEKVIGEGIRNKQIWCTMMGDVQHRITQIVNLSLRESKQINNELIEWNSLMTFVDLAGSDRNQRNIGFANLGRSVLPSVISSLASRAQGRNNHIPYRDSNLTRILQHTLGGNCCTSVLCVVSPSLGSYDQSLSTLRFAERCRKVINKPVSNSVIVHEMLVELSSKRIKARQRLTNVERLGKELLETRQISLENERAARIFRAYQKDIRLYQSIGVTNQILKQIEKQLKGLQEKPYELEQAFTQNMNSKLIAQIPNITSEQNAKQNHEVK